MKKKPISDGMKWTTQEDHLIRENYPKRGLTRTSVLLSGRTKNAVQNRAVVLGCLQRSYWSKEENAALYEHYETKGGKYVAQLTGRSEDAVNSKAHDIGLKRLLVPRSGKHSYQFRGYREMSGSHWNRIKRNAKSRELDIDLSIEYCWDLYEEQDGKCALTGFDIAFSSRVNAYDGTASLDRVDSTKGYLKGNVQWVHKDINKMKWDMSETEFVNNCRAVVNYGKRS